MEQDHSDDPTTHAVTLALIRRRRWYLWGLILIYLPASVTALQFTQSIRPLGLMFLIWLILLCVAVALVAAAKCPRCANTFHMRSAALSFSKKCCHCGLPM